VIHPQPGYCDALTSPVRVTRRFANTTERGLAATEMLTEMMLCEELFHTPTGVAFADFVTDSHRETWPIRSKRFRNWVRRCYYRATGAAAGAAVIRSTLDLLDARAQFDAPECRPPLS
jgi:hypothetical protein